MSNSEKPLTEAELDRLADHRERGWANLMATPACVPYCSDPDFLDRLLAMARTTLSTTPAGNDELVEVKFLLDRLDEFERTLEGHVAPAIARLRTAITNASEVGS